MKQKKEVVIEKLFEERNLVDVLRTYNRGFKNNKNNYYKAFYAFLVFSVLSIWSSVVEDSILSIQSKISALIEFSLILSSAAFGVVIAGFAIFASSLNSENSYRLASSNYKKTDVNNLNFLFSIFVFTLVTLISVFVSAFTYQIFMDEDSFIPELLRLVFSGSAIKTIYNAFFVMLATQVFFVLLTIWSFIWNLHQFLLVINAEGIRKWDEQS